MTRKDKLLIADVTRTKAEARAAYNNMTRVLNVASGSFEKSEQVQALAVLDAQPGEKVLEVGFGSGHAMLSLAESVGETGRVYGVDISDKMVVFTRRRLEKAGLGERAELIRGDGAHMPYADGVLDAAFLGFTLELFAAAEIPVVLAEIKRVLRVGGRLVVMAMSKPDHPDWRVSVYEWFHEKFPRYVDCRPIHVAKALADADFRITFESVKPMWGLPVAIVQGEK